LNLLGKTLMMIVLGYMIY